MNGDTTTRRVTDRLMRSLRRGPLSGCLCEAIVVPVRFSEVDSLSIVWHGVYVRYLEDAREGFGARYRGMGYRDIHAAGFIAPVVDIRLEYLAPLRHGDAARVECYHVPIPGARLLFGFRVLNRDTEGLAAVGYSVQVFIREEGQELELLEPVFYQEWKARWLKEASSVWNG